MYSDKLLRIRPVAALVSLCLFALCLSTLVARADVLGVSASPNPLRVNTSGTALVSVRWDVTVNLSAPQTIVLSSSTGDLYIAGNYVASPGGTLSRTVTHNGGGSQVFTFRDRIRISRTYVKQIEGDDDFYRRVFSHASSTLTDQDDVALLPRSGGGAISLRDVSIEFDDDTRFRSVAQNASLTARAVISTAGEGRIDASWEVAGPDGGQFRPIARVRQVLAGSRRTVFESPQLPTSRAGNYVVRFATQQNFSGTAEVEEIRYVVTPGGAAVPLQLMVPRAGESASAGTPFRWSQVAGAASYRLEFREGGAGGVGNGARIAAVDLRATETVLKPFTLARIGNRTPVFWRVVAFDGNGNVLTTSPARQLGGGTRSQSNN